MLHWLSSLSIRWKLQIAFMAVTMITTVYNRLLAASEMEGLLQIAKNNQVSPEVLVQLEAAYNSFIVHSFWESGAQFVVQFAIIAVLANVFVRPILSLRDSLRAIGKGDLTKGVEVTSSDEMGELETSFNSMLATLNRIISNVDYCGIHMGQSAYQIASISHEIESITVNQEARSDQVMSVTKSISEFSTHVGVIANETAGKASETERQVLKGIRLVEESIEEIEKIGLEVGATAEQINHLSQSAKNINGILDSIHSIAEQTNLLALNAAIEAARAGESGRGFAVVADEVRSLAGRTAQSAGEVSRMLASFTDTIAAAVKGMNQSVSMLSANRETSAQTLDVLGYMGREVSETSKASLRISDVIQEQVTQYAELRETLASLFDILRKNALKISNTANISDALFKLSERLNKQLAGLTYDICESVEDRVPPKGSERRQAPRINSHLLVSVHTNDGSIEGLSQDISATGIGVVTKHPLPEVRLIKLSVKLPQASIDEFKNQKPLMIKAEVVRHHEAEGRFYYGMRFVDLSAEAAKHLLECQSFFKKAA